MSIVINGGGISGVVLAFVLSKLTLGRLRIKLIDNMFNSLSSHMYDSRYLALSRSSYYKLMSFGISSILSSCSVAIKQIEININDQDSIIFSASDYHVSALGYVIKLYDIQSNIFKLLNQLTSIDLFYSVKLQNIKRNQFNVSVFLSDGSEITARLLIAADGSYSFLGTVCGMEWEFFDYKQIAVITNITTSIPNEGCAFEKFTSYGSIALLPILNHRSTVIWCIPLSYKQEILNWSSSEFCRKLQDNIGWKLGCVLDVDRRYFFPLFLRRARCHISHRLALVGNAAQTIHPIAGQGFNLGFRDIYHISKIISDANINNIDIGDYSVLKLYQQNRELDQFRVINMTHSLVRMFNSSFYPLMFASNIVLIAMKHSKFLRDIFIKTILTW